MKQGIAGGLQALAVEVDRQKQASKDYVGSSVKMTMQGDGNALVMDGVGLFGMRPLFHEQVGDKVGIPRRYYELMQDKAPGLLAANVNHWLHQDPGSYLVRTMDGKARAFLSDRYRALDNWLVLEAALQGLAGADIEVASCKVTEKHLYLKVVFPGLQKRVEVHQDQLGQAVGRDGWARPRPADTPGHTWSDVLQPGIVLSNSEVGCGAVNVQSLLYTVECQNGAIIQMGHLRQFHVGKSTGGGDDAIRAMLSQEAVRADDKAFVLKLRDVVKAATDENIFLGNVQKVETAARTLITGKVEAAVANLQERYSLRDYERDGVMDHLLRGGRYTQWGLSSAVTRTAQDVDDYERATELERVGGQLLELAPNDWQRLVGEVGRN